MSTRDKARFDPVERTRLRASLRLLFDGTIADRIGLNAGNVVRRAIWEWTFEAWRGRLRRRQVDQPGMPPLSPPRKMPARGAVALALHLGMGWTIETLAESSGASTEQIGVDFYRTRAALNLAPIPACSQFISSIGRYRDSSFDIADRASLLRHAHQCNACRTALERFHVIDATLLDQIERETAALLDAGEPMRQPNMLFPVTNLTVATIIVAMLLMVGIVLASGRIRSGTSAPDAATESTNRLSGWILTQDSNGQLTAINLETAQTHPIGPTETRPTNPQTGFDSVFLSPDRRLIARQVPLGQAQAHAELIIETIDGNVLRTVDFSDQVNVNLSGWLGNETVLEVEQPLQAFNESREHYITTLREDSSVVAVDVSTGEQHVIFRGSVSSVFPSPDSTLVVVNTLANLDGGPPVIELRPIEAGQIGGVISRLTLGYSSDPVWASDSSHFYVALSPRNSASPLAASGPSTPSPDSRVKPLTPASVSRTGAQTELQALPDGLPSYPVAISPDGQFLFEVSISNDAPGAPLHFRLWRAAISGDEVTALTGPSPNLIQNGSWSPDGQIFMVQDYHPFLLGPSVQNVALGDVWSTSILAVFPNGQTETVRTQIGSVFGSGFLGWLPASAFPNLAVATSGGHPGNPTPVNLTQPGLRLDASSQASPDGRYVVLREHATGSPVIWDRSAGTGRRLPDATTDLSWLPESQPLIAAGKTRASQSEDLSRLMTFAPTFNGSVPAYDFRAYDPASIGAATDKHYAEPLFSPNEGALAFFVKDDRDGSIALWFADYRNQTRSVYQWNVPPGSKIDRSPVAAWIDNTTLLFTVPGDWRDGLPRQVQLHRLTLHNDGTVQVDTLVMLRAHGNEHGVNLRELVVNQATGHIAYRLRHFTRASGTDGFFDSVDIVTVAHIDSPIELSRQGAGVGLSWSPDGRVLAAGFPSELRFFSSSGELLGKLNGFVDPSSPEWVSPSEIWFEAIQDRTEQVISVRMH